MRLARRAQTRLLILLMMVNFVLYVLVELSRHGSHKPKVIIPRRNFWKRFSPSKAYWNRQQQTLEHIYNPILALLSNKTVSERVSSEGGAFNSCLPDLAVASEIRGFKKLPDRFKDFLHYFRCRDYPLLLDQPHKCQKAPFLLLAIKSLIPHIDRRQAIRKSWGKEIKSGDLTIVRVFLLGQTPPEDNLPDFSDLLHFESQTYGDILLWDYKDTFFNLTLKEVLFLKWTSRTCPDAQYIFKGDDDVFVNIHQVLDYLRSVTKSKAETLFIGDVIEDARPKREKKLKYYIPASIYKGFYPPYAGGGGYLYSGKLVSRLTNISDQVLLYPIDDVYTGMCLRKLGLAPEKHKGFKTFDIKKKHRDNMCNYTSLILVHSRKPQEIVKIWKNLQDPHLNC